jgi:dephospho-CoA kinase
MARKLRPRTFVLGLTGYTCAGKSEFARLLESKGFARLTISDFTREVARARGLPVRRHATWELFKQLVREEPTWRVPRALRAIRALRSPTVVVDGIRVREEAAALKRRLGPAFLLVEVRVPEEVRRRRARLRRRSVDPGRWDRAAEARWRAMDREEVRMINRLRPLVDAVVSGGD